MLNQPHGKPRKTKKKQATIGNKKHKGSDVIAVLLRFESKVKRKNSRTSQ